MKLFRNDGVCRIGSQPWGRQIVDQDRVDSINRAGYDCITEPDVDLCFAPRFGDFTRDQDSSAGISSILSDFLYGDRWRIEGDAVVALDTGDVTKGQGNRLQIAGPEPQQICVSCRVMRHVVPKREQQGTFEQKALGMS